MVIARAFLSLRISIITRELAIAWNCRRTLANTHTHTLTHEGIGGWVYVPVVQSPNGGGLGTETVLGRTVLAPFPCLFVSTSHHSDFSIIAKKTPIHVVVVVVQYNNNEHTHSHTVQSIHTTFATAATSRGLTFDVFATTRTVRDFRCGF